MFYFVGSSPSLCFISKGNYYVYPDMDEQYLVRLSHIDNNVVICKLTVICCGYYKLSSVFNVLFYLPNINFFVDISSSLLFLLNNL